MDAKNIKPEKITKPIQLLAVWLLGLILLVSALITAAATIKKPEWLSVFFSISAVSIIPLFLILIFLLQTRFRPQLQEDEYYSKYLDNNTKLKEPVAPEILFDILSSRIDEKLVELSSITKEQISLLNERVNEFVEHESTVISTPKDQSQPLIGKFDDFIKENKNVIYLNQNLVRFNEIHKLLVENNLKIDEIFGAENDTPERFLLSFGASTDFDTIKTLINSLVTFGLTHLRIITESFKQNTIYIGSYAYKDEHDQPLSNARITKELLLEINSSTTTNQIYSVVQANMILK